MPELPKDRTYLAQAQVLLRTVAEELKLPLMQIMREAELTALTESSPLETLKSVQLSANSALELVDSYMLGLELAERQQMLELEPVTIGSVLYDVAHKLNMLAKRYGVSLEVQLSPPGEPVMANRVGLNAAMFSMGSAFIESLPAEEGCGITLAAHRTNGFLAAGIYSSHTAILPEQLHKIGASVWMRQPLSQFSATSGAGIFVAKAILESMSARLRTAHYHKQAGLAAILQPSHQLELV